MHRCLFPAILIAAACTAFLPAQEAPSFRAVNLAVSQPDASAGRGNMMIMIGMAGGRNMTSGRAVFEDATMLTLIESAWGLDRDGRVIGGPSWLGSDHFDLRATASPASTEPQMQAMLQALLAERFGLKVHMETRPFPGYALQAGKAKSKLKPATGGPPGCQQRFLNPGASPANPDQPQMITAAMIGSMTFHVTCTNQTIAAFSTMLGNMLSNGPQDQPTIEDDTDLTGSFDFVFDLEGSLIFSQNTDTNAVAKAIETQTGLVLQKHPAPLSVVVVDAINENFVTPAGAAPPLPPPPAEFDVASVKPVDPNTTPLMGARGGPNVVVLRSGPVPQVTPGGEVTWNGANLQQMILFAYDMTPDRLVGAPAWLTQDRWAITAKTSPGLISNDLTGMTQKLLEQRFKLAAHTDRQTVDAYVMSPSGRKVTLKPNTAGERSTCTRGGDGQGVQSLVCTATTMAQLADQLPNTAPVYFQQHHATDQTGISGAYDFTLHWVAAGILNGGRGMAVPDSQNPAEPAAPAQVSTTDDIFQAVEKTLGVKVALGKAPMSVLVIDHIERTATEN